MGILHTEERLFARIQSKGLLVFIVKPNFLGFSICIAKLGFSIVYSTVAGCIYVFGRCQLAKGV